MNAINPDLKFTIESHEDFENGRLATLDAELYMKNGRVHHSYYEKPMKTPLLLMQKSAMGEQQKHDILSNELIRRLSKLSDGTSQQEQIKIVDSFTRQMKNSGYDRKNAHQIITSGLVGHNRKRERARKEGRPFYKTGKSTLTARNKKKLMQKTNWYKNQKKDPQEAKISHGMGFRKKGGKPEKNGSTGKESSAKAVIFVPYTHGSALARLQVTG